MEAHSVVSNSDQGEKKKTKRNGPPPTVPDSAKKKRKRTLGRNYDTSRVYIGEELARWNEVKNKFGFITNPQFARHLLNNIEATATMPSRTQAGGTSFDLSSHGSQPTPRSTGLTSTPGCGTFSFGLKVHPSPPGVSDISAAESESEDNLSGVQKFTESDDGDQDVLRRGDKKFHGSRAGRTVKQKELSQSFIDPLDLTIEVTVESGEEQEDEDDPDYDPNITLTAILSDEIVQDSTEIEFEELFFGIPEVDVADQEQDKDTAPGVWKMTENDCKRVADSTTCLVFLDQLIQLAGTSINTCSHDKCGKAVSPVPSFVGSALYLKWTCPDGHVGHVWCSQPVMNRRLHSGDFMLAATIITSGNNFSKIALWAKMMNFRILSKTTFFQIQSFYVVPTVQEVWDLHQQELLSSINDVIVLGDGRNDSPGHCAQYCSYSLMDQTTKKILAIKTIDKREVGRKSANMEKEGFLRAMAELREKGVRVKEVVTDAHLGIGSVMKNNFPDVKHSHDIWHAAKNLGKKIVALGSQKQHAKLMKWTKEIVNHFWFTCRTSTDYKQFVGTLRGTLHHITDQHEWALGRCLHEPLTEGERKEKQWLDAHDDSETLKELASILLNPRLLNKISYYLNFRSTAELEAFHQHILMYCAKRFAYSPPVYNMRNILAALDNNNHADRTELRSKNGEVRYHRCFNKNSGRWTVGPEKEPKTYAYMKNIMETALIKRMQDGIGMSRKRDMAATDPRQIAPTITGIVPPPTAQLVKEQLSRFTGSASYTEKSDIV